MAPVPRTAQGGQQSGGGKALTFTQISRLARARAKEYSLQSVFKYGYRNKEDISNLPANTLVVGSQNVLTNAAERIGIRQGYALDGTAGNQNTYGIDSAYDFLTQNNGIQNLRKWGSNLEMRYVNPATSVVSWINILSTLVATNLVNFTSFYDLNGEVSDFCLFVNGDNNVWEWSGGLGSFASSTSTTITVQGTKNLAQLGFYQNSSNAGKFKLLINGVVYTYTNAVSSSQVYNQNPTNNKVAVSPTQWSSQLFTTGAGANSILLATIEVNAVAGNSVSSANFTATINLDNAGVPGAIVATATASEPVAYTAGDYSLSFNFPNATVLPNTNYHLVISSQGSTHTVYTGNMGSVGTNLSTNSGVTWSPQNGYMYATVTETDSSRQTFTGVSPTPSGMNVGDAVIQQPAIGNSTTNANVALPTSFTFDLISTLTNQVWYGSLSNNNVYFSRTINYQSTVFSTPARLPAEGSLITLDAPPTALSPQAQQMYISAGRDQWWVSQTLKETVVVSTVATPTEALYAARLKTAFNQGAQGQGAVGHFKNSLVYISNETIINALGLVKNVFADPQVINMSDSIKYDIDAYNFANAQVLYDNYFIYVVIPANGVVRMYNVVKKYWEAPQLLPISRLYHITTVTGNVIYGHSSLTNESYQLFTGYNDNGNPIKAVAAFPYVASEGGSPNEKKSFNKVYTEGYISSNTTIQETINYDFGGFSGTYNVLIKGVQAGVSAPTIFNRVTDGSLGQNPLGSEPIGSILNLSNANNPKFRIVNTMPRINMFEYQIVYSSNDIDQQWELLRFGPAINSASDIGVEVTQ